MRRTHVRVLLGGLAFFVLACQPDDSPLKLENETLRKQAEKQESVIISLQDGNKVMQQQIDLLNKELREAKEQVERVMTERTSLTAQLDVEEVKNRKLAAEAQKIAEKAAQLGQALRVDDKGGVAEELSQPFSAVAKATEEALSKNGYGIRVTVRTDQKAVYVTERKMSQPASLEVPGFRNQYLVSLQVLAPNRTRLHIKAEFERMTQGNRILQSSPEETAEIERRLIAEINRALPGSKV